MEATVDNNSVITGSDRFMITTQIKTGSKIVAF